MAMRSFSNCRVSEPGPNHFLNRPSGAGGSAAVAGLAMAPDTPTFLEARDALIAAAATIDPHDADIVAQAFAGRGMGSDIMAERKGKISIPEA